MAFIPFFSRPEPGVMHLDRVVASVQVAGVDIYVTPRGIGAELIDNEGDADDVDDEGEQDSD